MTFFSHQAIGGLLTLAVLWLCPNPAPAAGPLAIKAGKLIPISGEPLENAVILIRDGKIEAVGTDLEIPVEAKVIDASDKVVMPGFIDAHNPSGMSQANERNSNVPFLSAVDSIDPILNYFEDCRRHGITTAGVVPGNSTMIGGRGAIVKTAGSYVDDMLLKREAGLKISLRPVGGSRMSHLARLRRELDKVKRAMEEDEQDGSASSPSEQPAGEEDDKGDEQDEEEDEEDEDEDEDEKEEGEEEDGEEEEPSQADLDEGMRVLRQALQGKLPVFLYCDEAMDVGQALRLVEQYGLDPIFVLGQDCHKAADLLAGQERPVILDPTLVYWETDPQTREDRRVIVPRAFLEAEVPFIFQTSSNSRQTNGDSYLWYQAATAIKYGMPREDALRALTLTPAELLGIDQFVGSIEAGKDADLVILSGDPLAVDSWVEMTLVGGETVYRRSEDMKLKRLLEEPAE